MDVRTELKTAVSIKLVQQRSAYELLTLVLQHSTGRVLTVGNDIQEEVGWVLMFLTLETCSDKPMCNVNT